MRLPLRVSVIKQPARSKRLLFDIFHTASFPFGFFPNDDLDQLRLASTSNLLSRRDTAVVASVLAWLLPFLSFLGICSETFSPRSKKKDWDWVKRIDGRRVAAYAYLARLSHLLWLIKP